MNGRPERDLIGNDFEHFQTTIAEWEREEQESLTIKRKALFHWLITIVICYGIIGLALWWRFK